MSIQGGPKIGAGTITEARMQMFVKTALALGLLTVAAQARDWDSFTPREPSLRQSGHWEWAWDGSDGLGVSVFGVVHYQRGGPARISISGPNDVLEKLRVGQGQIRFCDDCRVARAPLDITVSGVPLREVALAGSDCDIQMGRLDQDALRLSIAGTGRISAEGRIDDVSLSIAGSGTANLEKVAARRANIHIAGSGDVALTPRDEANIHVAGSGNVRMTAAPVRLNQYVTGSGGMRIVGN
jgi:hypothetical protein